MLTLGVPVMAEETVVNDVYAPHGMVSSAHELASRAGIDILHRGGNAIDAAVATALALNVVEFNGSGIGGGGYMTIRFAETGEVICLDYREEAPASATRDMYASERSKGEKWSVRGGKAVGIPGWLKGIEYALSTYGTMTLAQVASPAVRLAEEGVVVSRMHSGIIAENFDGFSRYNDPEKVPFFEEGLPMEAGRVLKQPDLARTFRLVGEKGSDVFYNGEIGEALVVAVNEAGGSMTMDDLRRYRIRVRRPVQGTYRGYRIFSMPPSSSGGTHVIQLLNIMENFDVKAMGHNTPAMSHTWAEATKLVFADRNRYMADSDFVKLPLAGLLSKEYAQILAARIPETVAEEVEPGDPWEYEPNGQKTSYVGGVGSERQSTTSFSVVDQRGNIVTSTNSINYFCGSGVMVPGYGILLNNEMDDFSQDPESVNAPAPGKRPLSSMSPTIILDPQGRPFMSLGAAGSTRIITAIVQIIMNVIDHGMTMDEAIEKCRIHNQSGRTMLLDRNGADASLVRALRAMGYDTNLSAPGKLGTAQGILFDNLKGVMDGGADGRRLGVPVGF
ncbi:MAG: gamma-glutamyltransferase [Dethiosulfovibrio peptidovorans]|nr:MAG: gamma-glutamyltransferase [Dethiosulfovibrio peptidovorans]